MNFASHVKRMATLMMMLISVALIANGGGVLMSDTISTGNIALVNNKDITLEKEYLNVKIEGNYADVNVRYTFNNHGKTKCVLYGFPVSNKTFVEDGAPETGSKGKVDESLNFKMNFNGVEKAVEVINREYKMYKEEQIDEYRFNADATSWYTSNLEFPNGTSTLDITYRITNTYKDSMASSKSGFSSYSLREFVYILAPSGSWGNGKVKEFLVTLDFTEAADDGLYLVSIEGLKLKKKGDIYTGNFKNFNMAKAKSFVISYSVYGAVSRGMTGCWPWDNGYLAASSGFENHGPEKIFDCDFKSAWVENSGKGGKGEWIEFEFNYVAGIVIFNGMIESREAYYQYNRIKKLRLDLSFPDGRKETKDVDLEDGVYPENPRDLRDFYDVIYTDSECTYYETPAKARITILEVYRGSRFNKTCISEVYKMSLEN